MTKQEAVKLFGTVNNLAKEMGCSRFTIAKWPETLPRNRVDQIVGAHFRVARARQKFIEGLHEMEDA